LAFLVDWSTNGSYLNALGIYKILALVAQEGRMLQQINQQIIKSLDQSGRIGQKVTLIAVSKTRSLAEILKVYEQGVFNFGENYVQEAVEKIQAAQIAGINDIHWHMVGPVQSNKAKQVADAFDWIHSLSSLRLAKRLNRFRAKQPPLNCCLQVNIDRAPTKNGVDPDDEIVLEFAQAFEAFAGLKLRGLMVMPDTHEQTQCAFNQAFKLFERIKLRLSAKNAENFDTLSMGMSGDYGLAIEAGSTMVRIGIAIFGPRSTQ